MRREAGKGGQRLSGEQKEPWTRNGETPLLILALLFHGVTSGGHRAFLDSIFSSTKWGGALGGSQSIRPSIPVLQQVLGNLSFSL